MLGFAAWQLEAGGYEKRLVDACDGRSVRQLCAAGVPLQTLLESGSYTVAELFRGGYNAFDMLSANFSVPELKRGGYSCEELHASGVSFEQLRLAGFAQAALDELNELLQAHAV